MDLETYFHRIKQAWAPLESHGHIIPFCTPLPRKTRVLVIGTNHSFFDEAAIKKSGSIKKRLAKDKLAKEFAESPPKRHLYRDYPKTPFCEGLRDVCLRARVKKPDSSWMGTNRCAIQTGSGGLGELKTTRGFRGCQFEMDIILRAFIEELSPTRVLLFGNYAADLLDKTRLMKDRVAFRWRGIRVIPLHHPNPSKGDPKISRGKAADRLKGSY